MIRKAVVELLAVSVQCFPFLKANAYLRGALGYWANTWY